MLILLFFAVALLMCNCRGGESTRPSPERGNIADAGMVVSAHPQASAIGASVLADGGSAIDAAVAVQFALAVCYPIAGNIGGGGFLVFRREDGTAMTLDFRETAPMAAHTDMYLDSAGQVIEGASTLGHRSCGVPGSVAGMWKAHQQFGTMPWKDLLQPATDLAEKGFPITAMQALQLNENGHHFEQLNPGNTYLRRSEGPWHEGDTLRQSDLAKTLSLIRDHGPDGFYRGRTAQLILAEMRRGGGLIDSADLEGYQAIWRGPLVFKYDSFSVITMPPPSSGGIALGQLLSMLEPLPLREWGHNRSRTVHYLSEAQRRVYADRATHLGDPDFYAVPQSALMNPEYLQKRMSSVSARRASSSREVQAGVLQPQPESPQTTHFSIVDRGLNAVSLTTTLNDAYGSKVFVDGAGFLLNNEMDDFSSKPGTPNLYGLLGGKANAIEPGKRMLSSMSPTIVEKNGKLYALIGSPGGSTIINSVLQTFLNLVEFDMSMQQAVSAPRVHHQWYPDSIRIEPGALPDSTIAQLRAMGHSVYSAKPMGRVDAVLVLPDRSLEGGADPRGDDRAIGVMRQPVKKESGLQP